MAWVPFFRGYGKCALRLYHLGVLARTTFAADVYNNNVHLQGMIAGKHVHEAAPCYTEVQQKESQLLQPIQIRSVSA